MNDVPIPASHSPAVIIVGSEPTVIIPVARALSRNGLRCVVAVPPDESFSVTSRAVADVIPLHGSLSDATALLGMAAASVHAELVIPTTDSSALMASAIRIPALGMPLPAREAVEAALDAEGLTRKAAACGLPPRTAREAAMTVGVGVLMQDGAPAAVFQQRTAVQHRRERVEAVSESMALDPQLVEQSVRLLRSLDWNGPALVEFSASLTTGEYQFAGMQPHLWDSIALAIMSGVDFPTHMWHIAHGRRPLQEQYALGVRVQWAHWRNATDDSSPSEFAEMRRGSRRVLWSWRDPLPSLQVNGSRLTRTGSTLAERALKRLMPGYLAETIRGVQTLPPGKRASYVSRRARTAAAAGRRTVLPQDIASVIFVCHGNVMRSAAAEGFLKAAVAGTPLAGMHIASAGTNAVPGRHADERVRRAALELGVSLDTHRSRPLDREMLRRADVVFAMDDLNVVNITSQYPEVASKTVLLGGIAADGAYDAREIIDPYFGSEEEVATTVKSIHADVAQLARALIERHRGGSAQEP